MKLHIFTWNAYSYMKMHVPTWKCSFPHENAYSYIPENALLHEKCIRSTLGPLQHMKPSTQNLENALSYTNKAHAWIKRTQHENAQRLHENPRGSYTWKTTFLHKQCTLSTRKNALNATWKCPFRLEGTHRAPARKRSNHATYTWRPQAAVLPGKYWRSSWDPLTPPPTLGTRPPRGQRRPPRTKNATESACGVRCDGRIHASDRIEVEHDTIRYRHQWTIKSMRTRSSTIHVTIKSIVRTNTASGSVRRDWTESAGKAA